jgi:hypothetical protein
MRDLVAREVWPSYFAPVIELEATAIRIHEWEMRVVPGLLQTEDYARAVISAGRPRDTSAAELAREPGVIIQILPFTASDHPGTDGPILVYDFDGASSVAYTECNGGGRIVESANEVGDLMMIINIIRAAALPRRESVRLIQQIRSELADA